MISMYKKKLLFCILCTCSARECSSALLDSTALLFKRCTMFVRTTSQRNVSVITAAASLLCTTLQYIQGEKEKMCAQVFTNTSKLLREWISKTDVIGGKMFGSEVIRQSNRLLFSLGSAEIEVHACLHCYPRPCRGQRV